MRTRHKPPTLVSMWMLDVFCCALGCVTLLWLLNTRQAADNSAKAGAALQRLATTEADLSARQAELLALQTEAESTRRRLTAELEELRGKFLALTEDRDDTAKKLALAQGDLSTVSQKLTAESARVRQQADELAKKRAYAGRLEEQLADRTKAADDAAAELKRKAVERSDLDAKLAAASRTADALRGDLQSARRTAEELAAARGTIRDLTKKATDANATVIDLQGQKAKLADKLDKLQSEADSRFAGIALTGRRVCFVIDMSGSMKLLDEKTPAADKWAGVVETVGRVMRSLAELDSYQVVLFGREAAYLFGGGDWQPYRGEESVRRVTDALRRVEPKGDTNLHAGLDLAFRLRPGGLDTVYLFSDGLPTSGPGLTAAEEKSLADSARTERLTRLIRTTLHDDWNRPRGGQRVRVNAVGFFYESPEVGAFLWALARENDGSFVGMSRP
jgi:hypothetical protein